jgi:hypothetical protein
VARDPSEKEQQRLVQLLSRLQESLASDAAEVKRLTPPSLPGGIAPSQAAAWTLVSRVLFNLDEFITRE